MCCRLAEVDQQTIVYLIRTVEDFPAVGLSHSKNSKVEISMKKIITVIATPLCFAFVAGATDVPKTEVFLGYSLVRLISNGDIIPSRDVNGGSSQFVYNFSKVDGSCPAMAQGPTRLARGQAFHKYVSEKFGAKHGVTLVPLSSAAPP
jgi:hypothetical protein